MPTYDVVVIGGGIAGASLAAQLASERTVLLLEMEDHPGLHSTGRSAALFIRSYGNETVRALTRASHDFFQDVPAGFTEIPLLKPRRALLIANLDAEADLHAFARNIASGDIFEFKTPEEAAAIHPILRPETLSGALLGDSVADIDVDALHHGFLRQFKARGGHLQTGAAVVGLSRHKGRWRVSTAAAEHEADIIVNAAGAWAGEVAHLAGASDVGIQPLRRSACLVDPPAGMRVHDWPVLGDVSEQFYVKPSGGRLMLSPGDETPSPACDAQAEELDIAIAVDRVQQHTTLDVHRIEHRWAGLRTFVADRSPVIGFDPLAPRFFWHAALGGSGIQTAPAASAYAAELILDRPIDADLVAAGFDPMAVAPARFQAAPAPVLSS